MLTRLIDFLKNQHITTLFTSLTSGGNAYEQSEVGISSLMDTWILLRMIESANERNRILYVLKSRGMAHSNQMREFQLSDRGIGLLDVYTGSGTVYTGSARMVQEAKDQADGLAQQQAAARQRRELQQEQATLAAQAEAIAQRLKGIHSQLDLSKLEDRLRQQVCAGRSEATGHRPQGRLIRGEKRA